MLRKSVMLITMIILFLPANAIPDGCPFVEEITGANLEVKATTQRAVLWLRDSTWEIHIMPVFEREKAKAAWVVPFPVQPVVKEGSGDFFNELELLTAPIFVDACLNDGRNGCGFTDGTSGGQAQGGSGHVEIWEQGSVGELDYVVISADEQTYIVEWLKSNNYHVTSLAETSLKKIESQKSFFFAAKLAENADPTAPLTPVRFILPDLKTPMYPLVLTGLGVPEGASLELSLWLIFPDDTYYVPASHGYDTLDHDISNIDEYDRALSRFYLTHTPGTLALLHAGQLSRDRRIEKEVCVQYFCLPLSELGVSLPENWCPEINELVENNNILHRYQGRLGPLSLSSDLTFGELPENGQRITTSNTYINNICDDNENGCR